MSGTTAEHYSSERDAQATDTEMETQLRVRDRCRATTHPSFSK
jgi:hypothetical protein